jgi:cytochrome c peroxidase
MKTPRGRAVRWVAGAGVLGMLFASCRSYPGPDSLRTPAATPARVAFERGLDSLSETLDSLATALDRAPSDQARHRFRAARAAYKRIECLLEDLGPSLAAELNGPLPEEAEDRPAGPLGAPAGFQIIEGAVFLGGSSPGRDSLRATIRAMSGGVRQFRRLTRYLRVGDALVLDAMRLELARVVALGLAGVDADLSGDAVVESAAALEGMRDLVLAARVPWGVIDTTLAHGAAYLRAHPGFGELDRLTFIVGYATPASRAVAAARAALPDPSPPLRRLWRQGAATLFERDAFDASAYAPDFAPPASPELVALGRRLFFEPRLSGPATRSCAFCHDPARAFTDGRRRSALLPGVTPAFPRNTPTLLNAAYQPRLFDDARAGSLEAQAQAVLGSPGEMGGNEALAAERLGTDLGYRNAFARALHHRPDSGVTGRAVRAALAAYVRSLSALESRFDHAARGDTDALTAAERRGFTLFMGKGRCGACHFLPFFNGTMPPEFVASEPEIIGVPERAATHQGRLDGDPGRAGVDHEPTHRAAFKVPTLRNITLTAPYMHNGTFTTLDQVIDFYNRGGGAGIGARVPGQTLPSRPLHLTRAERDDLRAFLGALTDTLAM